MNTQIQAIHFKADQKLQGYISKKLEKLETFYSGIIDAQVFLKVENSSVKENKTIEIKLNAKQNSFIQTVTSRSFEASTDLAIESLQKAIKRYKGRSDALLLHWWLTSVLVFRKKYRKIYSKGFVHLKKYLPLPTLKSDGWWKVFSSLTHPIVF